MPNLDQFFGGEPGAADKALRDMQRTYGRKDGEHVFRARVAKLKRKSKSKPKGKRK